MPEQMTLPGIEPDDLPLSNHDPTHDCAECGCAHDASESREHEGAQYCPDCLHCPSCNGVFARYEGRYHNSELHCSGCVFSCENCEFTTTDENDIHAVYTEGYVTSRVSHSQHVCSSCCWECNDCNRYFSNDVPRLYNRSEERICERCSEDHYSSCEDCNDVIHNDASHFHEGREVTLCEACYRASAIESALIRKYCYKPEPEFQLAPGQRGGCTNLYLGWELECDRQRASDNPDEDITEAGIDTDVVYCKEDSSLNHGFEMVSHPGTWEFWDQFDWSFAPALAKRGYRSYDTTTSGMHVHVSKSWLTDHDRYKLLLFFRSNHALIFRLSRRASLDKMNAYAAIDHDRKAALLRKAKKGDSERYRAINMKPRRTVEFRLFRGTLRPESIKRNLALVTMICHFAKHTSPGRISDNDFLTYVMAHGVTIVGEPMATDLGKWVSEAVNGPCTADTGH